MKWAMIEFLERFGRGLQGKRMSLDWKRTSMLVELNAGRTWTDFLYFCNDFLWIQILNEHLSTSVFTIFLSCGN